MRDFETTVRLSKAASTIGTHRVVLIGKYLAGDGTASWILSYDPGSRKTKVLSVNSGGGYSEGVISNTDGVWTQNQSGTTHDGKPVSTTISLTISDDQTHTWAGVTTIDGERSAVKTDWKRVYDPSLER